ncbi:MAG TPA: regulatory protein RecX, partial [Gammaproteobacteria bacterium]|nr:regulatory protein RecX [Gammaproteobacteria bacterium]
MLTRREHGRRELADKLVRKGCNAALAAKVVNELERERVLSEERFADALVRARQERGYGPLRIRREMEQKGLEPALIEHALNGA